MELRIPPWNVFQNEEKFGEVEGYIVDHAAGAGSSKWVKDHALVAYRCKNKNDLMGALVRVDGWDYWLNQDIQKLAPISETEDVPVHYRDWFLHTLLSNSPSLEVYGQCRHHEFRRSYSELMADIDKCRGKSWRVIYP
ncbi:hypothetical protein [Corynebacterium glucuronolyticum]|uniref:Uncharacterized protein n=2 Tax=Corynebacterium glucuronolyticum TaxID=39791 RepID=A0AAX1L6W2_9CORY|nr:hypothetical protein [Corynebacterium glucuronolyticum]EEI62379.1 hypothetical protein HMPREF0293_2100 [Corynebacterium glucuronolyticum ATCC 51866]QRP70135.1 hypothetical protein I6J21_10170 [Corynebacterium glucuronolyticum]